MDPVAFGVAGDPVCQVLGVQDFPEGRVVGAVGGVLADLGQGRFPAAPAPVVGFQFRVGGWTLGAHPGNLQPCPSWRHSCISLVLSEVPRGYGFVARISVYLTWFLVLFEVS